MSDTPVLDALNASGGLLLHTSGGEIPEGWSTVALDRGVCASTATRLSNGDKLALKELLVGMFVDASAAQEMRVENELLTSQLGMMLAESEGFGVDESTLGRTFDFLGAATQYAIIREGSLLFNNGIDEHTLKIELRRMQTQHEQSCAISMGERFVYRRDPYMTVIDRAAPLDDVMKQLVRVTMSQLAEKRRQRDLHELIERLYETFSRSVQRTATGVGPDFGRLDSVESDFMNMLDATLRDSLTQAYNRAKTEEVLEALAQGSGIPGSGSFAVILLDIDHFKSVNDTYGHVAGDRVIVDVVTAIDAESRSGDIVARWGGEEFLVILPDTTIEAAEAIAERMRMSVGDRVFVHERSVTASFGVGLGVGGEATEHLIERVDAALYQAKEGGRNRVVVAEPPTAVTSS